MYATNRAKLKHSVYSLRCITNYRNLLISYLSKEVNDRVG